MRALGVAVGLAAALASTDAVGLHGPSGFRIGQDGSRRALGEDRAPAAMAQQPAAERTTTERFMETRGKTTLVAAAKITDSAVTALASSAVRARVRARTSSSRLRGSAAFPADLSGFGVAAREKKPAAAPKPAFEIARSLGIDTLKDETSFKERIASMKSSKAGAELLGKMAARVHAKGAIGSKESAQFAGLLKALKSNLDIAGEESEAL